MEKWFVLFCFVPWKNASEVIIYVGVEMKQQIDQTQLF